MVQCGIDVGEVHVHASLLVESIPVLTTVRCRISDDPLPEHDGDFRCHLLVRGICSMLTAPGGQAASRSKTLQDSLLRGAADIGLLLDLRYRRISEDRCAETSPPGAHQCCVEYANHRGSASKGQ